MPLPGVLLGLPWLAGVLVSAFTATVTWLAQFVTKRIAIIAAIVAAFLTLTAAFVAVLEGIASGFSYVFPVAANFGFLIPADLPLLVSAYTAARLAYWVYSWNVKLAAARLV